MPKKSSLSLQDAQRQLKQAVDAERSHLVERVIEVRQSIERLVDAGGLSAISGPLEVELHALFGVVSTDPKSAEPKPSGRITAQEKIDFIVAQLTRNGGTMEKSELLDKARQRFGLDRPPSFLDPALKIGPFERKRSDRGNQKTIVLKDKS